MGQVNNFSIWCDFLERDFLNNEFISLVDSGIVNGVTSNPTIFKNAILNSKEYEVDKKKSLNLSPQERYEQLATQDIKIAAKVLFPIYESKDDGFASIEVSPHLANDTQETVKEGRRLYDLIGFKNVMIKVPATSAGYKAMTELISFGININATLVFSPSQAKECLNAIRIGNKLFKKKNKFEEKFPSAVISVFVSRFDRKVDTKIKDAKMKTMRLGIMNASFIYQMIEEAKIDNVRCLFASTGVTDDIEDKSYYIKKLMYKNTINTAPLLSIKHYIDDWDTEETICPTKENIKNYFQKVESCGISLNKLYKELFEEGLTQFEKAYDEIISSLESRTYKEIKKITIEVKEKESVKNTNKKDGTNKKEPLNQMDKLKKALEDLIATKGSDLHIKANAEIKGRVNGGIVTIDNEIFLKEDIEVLVKELLKERHEEFVKKKNLDFMFKLNEEFRFRVNVFYQTDGISAAFRVIPITLPTIESMDLPEIIESFCNKQRGLVLVTGPTGCGKSTTLATMINVMNQKSQKHIITIEDPIEFVYKDDQSIVNQRSVGQDAISFSDALRAALREDPDVIMVGEMRDVDTIRTAIRAAETGHLVLSTLHTIDSKETINRIISMFDGEEQKQVRQSLSSVLQAVVSQRLLKRKLGGGRIAAVEVMIKNARVEDLIAGSRESEIKDAIEEGRDVYGSQSFNQALLELYKNESVSYQEALREATSAGDLKILLDNHDAQKSQHSLESKKIEADKDVVELKIEDIED